MLILVAPRGWGGKKAIYLFNLFVFSFPKQHMRVCAKLNLDEG